MCCVSECVRVVCCAGGGKEGETTPVQKIKVERKADLQFHFLPSGPKTAHN